MAITANGTTFSYNSVTIGDVLSISSPSVSVATIDTTGIDDVFRTFLGGTIDSGEMSVEVMYSPDDAGASTILEAEWESSASAAPTAKTCIITFSDGSLYTFSAILIGFSASVAIDDKVTASVSLRVSGSIAITTP
jgi:hypothetical protein